MVGRQRTAGQGHFNVFSVDAQGSAGTVLTDINSVVAVEGGISSTLKYKGFQSNHEGGRLFGVAGGAVHREIDPCDAVIPVLQVIGNCSGNSYSNLLKNGTYECWNRSFNRLKTNKILTG